MASLVMIRANLFPVIIYREQRSEYIDALEEADNGDLVKFIGLLSQNQMKAARQAIKFVETSVPEPILLEKDGIEVIIKSGVEARRRKKRIVQKELLESSSRLSHLLEDITYQRLVEIADTLNREFKEFDKVKWENETYAEVKKIEERDGLYYGIILDFLMMGTDFSTATEAYYKCIFLSIDDVEKTEIGFFFQALGPEFTGGMCVLGGIWDPEFEPYDKFGKPKTIFADGHLYQETNEYFNVDFIGSEFQFSDLDSDEELELISNYKIWLEENLKQGLRSWHDHI
ncbi:hypothetical protein [Candidatus Chlorohelix sp.]|uniref:hypothetical protein n=1 Tax=Candidatus Chlorohelix sp. TaxID=3139201 RepID=UPI0031455A17